MRGAYRTKIRGLRIYMDKSESHRNWQPAYLKIFYRLTEIFDHEYLQHLAATQPEIPPKALVYDLEVTLSS